MSSSYACTCPQNDASQESVAEIHLPIAGALCPTERREGAQSAPKEYWKSAANMAGLHWLMIGQNKRDAYYRK